MWLVEMWGDHGIFYFFLSYYGNERDVAGRKRLRRRDAPAAQLQRRTNCPWTFGSPRIWIHCITRSLKCPIASNWQAAVVLFLL